MKPNKQDQEQPALPPQYQPLRSPSAGRILQPLSSEEEIRSEAQAAQSERPVSQDAVTMDYPSNASESIDVQESSSLVTEPLNPLPRSSLLQSHASTPIPSSQNGTGKKILTIFISTLVVVALGFGAYHYFLGNKLATADLVETTVKNTKYSYVEGWKSLPLGFGMETYTNSGENRESIAAVTVTEGVAVRYVGDDKPDDYYETIRLRAMSQENVESIRAMFKNGENNYTSDIKFNVKPDTSTGDTIVGLALTTGSCTREDGVYIVKRRTVIGADDGLHRHITVGASESDWRKNSATYEAILNSVRQASLSQN